MFDTIFQHDTSLDSKHCVSTSEIPIKNNNYSCAQSLITLYAFISVHFATYALAIPFEITNIISES
jgi:hypothetical protein